LLRAKVPIAVSSKSKPRNEKTEFQSPTVSDDKNAYSCFSRYGVNSGIGRSGKVLRRTLRLPDNTSVVTDEVVAAARAIDPRTLITAICDERLHFLQSLKTWPVFGRGSRRVAEVKSKAPEDGSGCRQARRHGSQVNLINNWELHRCGIRSGSGSEIP
jgi:hypothetical protein